MEDWPPVGDEWIDAIDSLLGNEAAARRAGEQGRGRCCAITVCGR